MTEQVLFGVPETEIRRIIDTEYGTTQPRIWRTAGPNGQPIVFGEIRVTPPNSCLAAYDFPTLLGMEGRLPVAELLRALDELRARDVRVVLLRVDSGGGHQDALPLLYAALRDFSRAGGKVVVYIQGNAGSTAATFPLAGDVIVIDPAKGRFLVHASGYLDPTPDGVRFITRPFSLEEEEYRFACAVMSTRTWTPLHLLEQWHSHSGCEAVAIDSTTALRAGWADYIGGADLAIAIAMSLSSGNNLPLARSPRRRALEQRGEQAQWRDALRELEKRAAELRARIVDGWVRFAAPVSVGQIDCATLSAISADLGTITAGKVVYTTGGYIRASGLGFGTAYQFLEWFGPDPYPGGTPDQKAAACSESTAYHFLKTNGESFYSGTASFPPEGIKIGGTRLDESSMGNTWFASKDLRLAGGVLAVGDAGMNTGAATDFGGLAIDIPLTNIPADIIYWVPIVTMQYGGWYPVAYRQDASTVRLQFHNGLGYQGLVGNGAATLGVNVIVIGWTARVGKGIGS